MVVVVVVVMVVVMVVVVCPIHGKFYTTVLPF